MKTLYALFFGLFSFCAAAQYCGPLHVHPGATGAGTGESWQDAFVHLQDALDAAQPGAQIWVAAGVYLPQKDTTGNATPANDRSKTFFINKDIQLYGGFAGAEQELSQRDPVAHPTILSGDLGTTGVATDNAYHVLWLALVSPLCIIDGFTITRGNANASDVNGTGGGILLRHQPLQYAAPVIRNCIIEHNHATTGGGFYTATDSWAGPSVSIEYCKFRNNTAGSGGGIYFQQSMVAEVGLQLTNVEFSDQSIGQYGGGLYANGHFTARHCRFENNNSNRGAGANLEGGTAILENCAFIGNTSLRNGGGLRMERTTATVVNCLFLGNEANILNESSTTSNAGGGMFYRGSNTSFAKLANCVFSGNKGQNGAGFAQTTTVLNTSSAELDNCTFAGNNGASAVARLQGNLTIENSIIFGNEGTALTGGTARSCIIEGGYAGTDNVSVDPLFVALPSFLLAPTAVGNLKLQSGSPAIDQSNNALAPLNFIADADGNHRMINCTIDRGAFEFGSPGASDRICYADADGDGLGNAAMPRLACNTCPGGFVSNNGDCDDSNSAITHTLPPPAAIQLTTEFCRGEPSITLRSIQSAAPERLVWVLVQAPPGSRFEGQEPLEFHPGAVNAEFSTGTDNLLMCSTPSYQNTPVNGVWMFETYYETAAGCRSAVQQGFSITVRQTSTTQLSATACNSYTFNGQTYTQSGIYTQMLTNAEGCDSLLVIELAIGQADTTQLSTTACNSYTFNGQTYTQSGIYTQMLTNAEGCDSLLVIELAIGQADTTQLSATACNSYTFNGQTYTQSGVYTQMLTNAEGCDSLLVIELAIGQADTTQLSATACNSYTFNGQTYTQSGIYTQMLTNAGGCDSLLVIELAIGQADTTQLSATACNSYTFNGQTYTQSGIYTQMLTNAGGCDSLLFIELAIGQADTTQLSATACNSYTFNGQTYTQSGIYTQMLTNAEGCDSLLVIELAIGQADTTQLSATACNSYTFNGQTYTQSGIYTQMLTNAEGCDSLLVIELAIGQADTTHLSATACNSYTFNGQTYTQSGIYTQMLTNAEGCGSLLVIELAIGQADTTQLSTTACNSYTFNGQTYTQSGIYTQMLTNAEGCDSLFTLHLEIVSPPALQFDVQHPSCADSGNGQATVAAAQGAPPFNYLWSNGQTTPVAIGLTTGPYTVTLTDANGCISIDTVTLTPQYQLLSSFTVMGTPVCHGDSTAAVTVSPMGGAAPFEYQWLHGPQTASLSGLPAGIYHVTITDANGCTAIGATIFTDPPLLDISIVQNNHILTSQELDVEYQWINCDTGLPIQDAVNQFFEAIESGRYAVVLSRGVCRDTSLCIEVMLVSATEQRSALPKAEAYPNPNNGRFVLRMPVSGQIALYDATGRLLRTEVHGAGEHTLFIDGPAGLYWLAVMYNQGVQTLRIIRQ